MNTPLHPLAWVVACIALLALACVLPFGLSGEQPAPSPADPIPTLEFVSPTPSLTPPPTATPTPLPAARVASGDHALFIGDWDAALGAFQAALQSSSDPEILSAALLGIGRLHYLTGEYPSALDALRQVTDAYPNSPHCPDAYFFLGQTYAALARYGDASQAYRSYLALRPGILDAFVSELSGDALSTAGDPAGALEDYNTAVMSPRLPTDFSLEIKMARTYTTLGDYATALVLYDDIYNRTLSDYTRAQVDYLKGQLHTALGETDLATNAYLDAVVNYPKAYDSYLALIELVNAAYPVDELQRGLVDYYAGEYGVALAAFDRYLNAGPAFPATAYYHQGLILRDQLDLANAIALWDLVIQEYPDSPEWDNAWEQKAYTQWFYLDQYADAEATLLAFVESAPQHPRAAEFLFDAARLAERDGRLDQAAYLWERLPSEHPNSPSVHPALMLAGASRYRLGDFTAAQATFWLAQSLAQNPTERSAAFFWIGKTQAALGDATAAQLTWEQTAAMDPTGYYSERARDLLLGRTPFAPPAMFDLGSDRAAERTRAEAWLRTTFNLPAETDLSPPGLLAGDPRFVRGLEFWRLGLYQQARLEFEDLRREVASDPANTYRLAVYLADLGLYRSAILAARQVLTLAGLDDEATLSAPILFNHIRFGAYYPDLVVPATQAYNFHPLFVWSVMRQESLFEGFIYSAAGARGLMQIIPTTGADIASRMGWPPGYTSDDLYRPLISVQLGLDYLADQRDYFGGDLLAALAAYNGGPGNAAAWSQLSQGDPDLFVEVIRFDETRRYLKSIYEIFNIYRRLYERVP